MGVGLSSKLIQQQGTKVSREFMNTQISYDVKKLFFTILYSLCITLSLISFIWDITVLNKVNALLGIFAFMLLSTRIRREYVPIYIFIGLLVTSFFVSSLFVGRTAGRLYNPIIFIPAALGPAIILLRGYVYSWGGYIVFYGLAGYFFILILSGVDVDSALKYCSHNGISQVILVACISLYIILSMEKKKIDLKPAFFTLAISIWAIGRSGIIAGFVLLLGLLSIRLQNRLKYIHIAIISLTIVLVYSYVDVLLISARYYSFFGNAIDSYLLKGTLWEDPERLSMWANYFDNLDIFRVIFGVNVVEDPWPEGEILAYNYHNSFIDLHLQTGFMGLITMALIIFSLFKFYRGNKVLFFLLMALILRSFTDLVIFFWRFDFIPFFFIFYFLKGTSLSRSSYKSSLQVPKNHSSPWCK